MARKALFPFLMAAALAGGYMPGYTNPPVKQPEPSIRQSCRKIPPGQSGDNLLQ